MLGVWLRCDLRLIDNPAVYAAVEEAKQTGAELVFIHDRMSTIGSIPMHPARIEHEARVLQDLEHQIQNSGYKLLKATNDDNIVRICADRGIAKIHSLQEWGDTESYECERRIKRNLRSLNIQITDHAHNGILRGNAYRAYENQNDPNRRAQMLPYWVGIPAMSGLRNPESLERLEQFLDKSLPRGRYAMDNWRADIGGDVSSRLSFDLACGAIAPERVVYEIQKREKTYAERGRQLPKSFIQFRARLGWRHNFIQSYESNLAAYPDPRNKAEWQAEHAELGKTVTNYAAMPWAGLPYDVRLNRWIEGSTGIPFIDATMKALHQTGWITFRQRQTTVSFAIDLLDLDWRDVLVETGKLFGDYTPGIHNPQLSLQAGVAIPERGPRIVNPLKQAFELDPNGDYVRKWLPELAYLPNALVHTPWKGSAPSPIVNVEQAMKAARKIWTIKHGLEILKQEKSNKPVQGSLF